MRHPRRRNVTTSMAGLKNSHGKISSKMVSPRDIAGNTEEEEICNCKPQKLAKTWKRAVCVNHYLQQLHYHYHHHYHSCGYGCSEALLYIIITIIVNYVQNMCIHAGCAHDKGQGDMEIYRHGFWWRFLSLLLTQRGPALLACNCVYTIWTHTLPTESSVQHKETYFIF